MISWKEQVRIALGKAVERHKASTIARELDISRQRIYQFGSAGHMSIEDVAKIAEWLEAHGYPLPDSHAEYPDIETDPIRQTCAALSNLVSLLQAEGGHPEKKRQFAVQTLEYLLQNTLCQDTQSADSSGPDGS